MPVEIAGETYWTPLEVISLFPTTQRPSLETILRYIRVGKLKATKLGRGSLISSRALRSLLDGDRRATQPPKHTSKAETPPRPPRQRERDRLARIHQGQLKRRQEQRNRSKRA
jgi:hypothetical protein